MDFLIYETIGEAIGHEPQSGSPPIFDELVKRAQLLSHAEEESIGRSSVLYSDVNPLLRSKAQTAAAERRIAAWLYIDARYIDEEIVADPDLLREFRALAAQVRLWLNKQRKESLLDERDKRVNDHIVSRTNELLRSTPFVGRMKQLLRSAPSLSLAELSAELAILKDEAKLLRDDGKYEGAIEQLTTAIALIDKSRWKPGLAPTSSPSDAQKKMAWHLADCLGMLGGNYRRNHQLEEAIKCFARGSKFEQNPRYGLSSSYNMVNAIVAPIEGGMRDATSQANALRNTVAALKRQIDPEMSDTSRRLDRWAWADLGQCCLLLGRLDEARTAYEKFKDLSDPASIRSSCQVLQNLQRALKAKGDEKTVIIDDAIELLQSSIPAVA
jgi:tetratricopeptide (TPR) repeat protein